MTLITITVTDVESGLGVPGAGVYLFEGGGGIEPAGNAAFSATTDANGAAVFDVIGFFRVGIKAEGYEAVDPPHVPVDPWKDGWTCWGAFGIAGEPMLYDFRVRQVTVPIDLPVIAGAALAVADAVLIGYYLATAFKLI